MHIYVGTQEKPLISYLPTYLTSNLTWSRNGGVEVKLHAFLTSALDGDEWLSSHPSLILQLWNYYKLNL